MSDLSRNESLVIEALRAAKAPQSAYALLDTLRDQGLRAPPQIYRALEKLTQKGVAHRLESLNAFVACNHPDCSGHSLAAFTICETCGAVGEINDASLGQDLAKLAGKDGFKVSASTVELRGLCAACESS
ncbi:transcriptional repressor [Pseudahrensia aquimaris]|uniref:Transcriptional repressor n=1 Tax=Pseudahrensia aquimaris TaxID=744461 RepID=A0ABW3FFV4_9HYPH